MFKFNDNYEDLEQTASFYDEFKAIKNTIEGTAYNALFEGKIADLAGEDEKTGIHLLQQLDVTKERRSVIDGLLAKGYSIVEPENGGMKKYESVVKVGNNYSIASTNEYPKARIAFADKLMYIIPKGNRTRGYNVLPGNLVLAKRSK